MSDLEFDNGVTMELQCCSVIKSVIRENFLAWTVVQGMFLRKKATGKKVSEKKQQKISSTVVTGVVPPCDLRPPQFDDVPLFKDRPSVTQLLYF